MKQTLTIRCPACKNYNTYQAEHPACFICASCRKQQGEIEDPANILERCPVCQCRQFYLMKDFNQLIGCLVMLAGIVLVPWTYGLSLPVFALLDWFLYKKVDAFIVCYRCACEFRGFKKEEKGFKPFLHHIGLKYDKYR
ncbi:MAG TPA: hypothetical protein VI749_03110 [Candidatus Omnitrophota bacterium]|nr:hypothetical protein [Candidatus Omnitrophota bacterium]